MFISQHKQVLKYDVPLKGTLCLDSVNNHVIADNIPWLLKNRQKAEIRVLLTGYTLKEVSI